MMMVSFLKDEAILGFDFFPEVTYIFDGCFEYLFTSYIELFHYNKERCPRGQRSTLGKRVYPNRVPWVRIPLSPKPSILGGSFCSAEV
jgi:hypothetical protein